MINFRKATFKNFLIFGDEPQTIEFNRTGIRYIYGQNQDIVLEDDSFNKEEYDEKDISSGSGKSSIPIGLLYGPYGVVQKKDKIALARVVNKKYKKNCEVTTEFDIDGKDIYLVKRYRAYKEFGGNALYFYKWDKVKNDWEDLSRADSDETQEKINKIIGINYATALKSILLSRDDTKDFLDMAAGDRFKIFENIIQLGKFKEKFDKLNESRLQLEKLLINIKTNLEAEKISKTKIYNYFKAEVKSHKATHAYNKTRIKELETSLLELGSVDYTAINSDIENVIKYYSEQLQLASQIKNSRDFIQKTEKEITDLEKKLKEVVAAKKKYDEELLKEPAKCTNCKEMLDKKSHEKHLKNIQDLLSKLTSTESIEKEIASKKTYIENSLKSAEESKKKILELNVLLKAITLDDKIKKRITNDLNNNKEIKLQQQVKEITTELASLKNYKDDYTRLHQFISDIKVSRLNIKNKLIEQKQKEKQLAITNIWIKVLDIRDENSIKQHVISKIIPAYNSILQENLNEIYNGIMRISFDSFLNEVIVYEGEEAKAEELSMGERARINLCINFSIYELTRMNLNASNVMFIDEMFNSMDVYSINKFIKLIKKKYANTLIHISGHSKGLEENLEADEIIKVERKDRESKIIFV